MRFAALMLIGLLFQQADPKDYYVFKKGTTWTYELTSGDTKATAIFTVDEVKDGKTKVVVEQNGESTIIEWHVEDGFLIWSTEAQAVVKVLKINSQKGEQWVAAGDGSRMPMIATNKGVVQIENTTGCRVTFDATHVRLAAAIGVVIDYYFVPKIGMVRMNINIEKDGNKIGVTMVLKQFVEGQ